MTKFLHPRWLSRLAVFQLLAATLLLSFLLASPLTTLAANITEYVLPNNNSFPYGLAAGPDGNLWFTELNGNKVAKITTAGAITEYSVPTVNSFLEGITAGPDGNLWFIEAGTNKIGKITTTGTITEYAVPTASSGLWGITAGPDGNLWFTENGGNKIGKITTAGVVTEYPVPTANSFPEEITTGPDGNLWFAEHQGNKIARISTAGAITEYAVPTANSLSEGITAGPDGNVWFTEGGANKIGKITPTGIITEYAVPTPSSAPIRITAGPDGNLWFSEYQGNNIGRITPTGIITEYAVPTATSALRGITSGPDGNIWFGESGGNKIGKLSLVQPPTLTKAFSPSTIQVGGTTTLTVTITNPGTGLLTNISFADTLPAGVRLSSTDNLTSTCGGTATANSASPSSLNLNGGTLAGSQTCSVSADFTASTTGVYTNTISTVSTNETGITPVNASATLTVGTIATTTSLSDNGPNPSTFGQTVNFTVALTPATATGTVTLNEGATVLGTATLSGGTASFSISNLAVGSHTLTATYGGDASHAGSTSSSVNQVVTTLLTITTLSDNGPNPSTFGQTVNFTVALAPVDATGTVTLNEGASVLGTVSLSGGTASFNISSLAVGSHTLTATYAGDATHAGSTSNSVTQTVTSVNSALTLSNNGPNPSTFGQTVSFVASINPATATGTVTLSEGATVLGTATLSSGTANFSISNLTTGSHTLTATYGGDTNNAGSTSNSVTQVVTLIGTTTTLTDNGPNPSTVGQAVSFTASVTPANATGTVTLKEGATVIGTATLSEGTANFTISTLSIGSHSIVANYGGDTNNAGSTSNSVVQLVKPVSTTTTLSDNGPNPSTFGQAVNFVVNVAPITATGTVTLNEGRAVLGTATLSGGTASFSISNLAIGSHSIVATYSGDATNAGSTSNSVVQVVAAPAPDTTTTTLTPAGPNPSPAGQPVTLTVSVAPAGVSGMVTLYDGSKAVSTATLSGNQATFILTNLTAGKHNLSARYTGDATHAGSSSIILVMVITSTSKPIVLPADLIAQLRLSPDREFGLGVEGDNLLSYNLTVKNVGPGQAHFVNVRFPIDPQLVVGYVTSDQTGVWVQAIVSDTTRPYIQIGLPQMQTNATYSVKVVMRAGPNAKAGSTLFTTYKVIWDDDLALQRSQTSNGVRVSLTGGSTNRNDTDGAVQLYNLTPGSDGTFKLESDFYAPEEWVDLWYTDASHKSVAIGRYRADLKGQLSVVVDTSKWDSGQGYVIAGRGVRSDITGAGAVTLRGTASSQAANDETTTANRTITVENLSGEELRAYLSLWNNQQH